MGRDSTYTEEKNQQAKDYLIEYESVHGHPFPSEVGLAVVLKTPKSTIRDWAKDGRGDFSVTLDACSDMQHMITLHGSLRNELNPTISKLVLANHGYSDRVQNEMSGPDGNPIEIDNHWQVEVIEPDA